ncbi:hypothetical protein ACIRPT_27285 [Streptomyces sp. NPDC101227]|uniref:hypothetical protein n=1 Tax=Streptomyces sp. NPDC101227 TaxID=3366136 RepID=UPI003812B480
MDWVLAGRWTDLGSHALSTTRPQLAALLEAMRAESGRREVLCLVHNWGRLASTPVQRLALRRLVTEAGGWTTTTFGESDRKALTVRVKHGD